MLAQKIGKKFYFFFFRRIVNTTISISNFLTFVYCQSMEIKSSSCMARMTFLILILQLLKSRIEVFLDFWINSSRYERNIVEKNEHLIPRADLPFGHQLKTMVQNG